jgi:hypothetical protein
MAALPPACAGAVAAPVYPAVQVFQLFFEILLLVRIPRHAIDPRRAVAGRALLVANRLLGPSLEDEAVPALGEDVEGIGRPDLEVLRASEAKNCDLLIEIGGRMDEVCESCHKVF